ncbi:hypothetical protein HBB16_05190 [Pseudonocardia sp. MCCB 268]|nr:hypothetical protein [Pseudonocardia cytotoxica]
MFEVFRDGDPIRRARGSRGRRDLVKILVARRRSVPRDRLMELLWPESDPSRRATGSRWCCPPCAGAAVPVGERDRADHRGRRRRAAPPG